MNIDLRKVCPSALEASPLKKFFPEKCNYFFGILSLNLLCPLAPAELPVHGAHP
jgi:hypothetical protein